MASALVIGSTPLCAAAPHGVHPAGNPGDWVTPDDYPPEALRANQAGLSAFRLDVNESGVVTGCTITASSGSPLLDDTTCRLLTVRARFVPAIDRKGRAMASTYSSAVRWSIPQDEDPASQEPVPEMRCTAPGEIQVSGLPPCYEGSR